MNKRPVYQILTWLFAAVWLVNGLLCKVIGLTPRHGQIVGRILGNGYAHALTIIIGLLECLIAIWIISGIKPKWCAAAQIISIGAMNLLEFILVPDLLLWGRMNLFFAALFIALIYYHGFIMPGYKPENNNNA